MRLREDKMSEAVLVLAFALHDDFHLHFVSFFSLIGYRRHSCKAYKVGIYSKACFIVVVAYAVV